MEDWIWANLPRRLASFIANLHDMFFTNSMWSDNDEGDVR